MLLLSTASASEMTVDLGVSFFPKKDIIIDADTPDEIVVKYHIKYSIGDGCSTDIITMYKLGGCLQRKYKTHEEESEFIIKTPSSSARRGKGAQTLRLTVRQEKRNSYDIIPIVTIIDGNEDRIQVEDPWFSSQIVTLTSRDEVINDSRHSEKLDAKESPSRKKSRKRSFNNK